MVFLPRFARESISCPLRSNAKKREQKPRRERGFSVNRGPKNVSFGALLQKR